MLQLLHAAALGLAILSAPVLAADNEPTMDLAWGKLVPPAPPQVTSPSALNYPERVTEHLNSLFGCRRVSVPCQVSVWDLMAAVCGIRARRLVGWSRVFESHHRRAFIDANAKTEYESTCNGCRRLGLTK